MAKNKKSFVLYTDYDTIFEKLTNEEAGKLIKHLFKYVNDKSPEMTDRIIDLIFEPIKQQLKRDLKNWKTIRSKRSLAGKASANKKQQNQHMLTHVESVEQKATKSTVTVNGTVNVNDTVTIKKERRVFAPPGLEEVVAYMTDQNGKSPDIEAKKFISHYSSNGWMVGKNKMKNWRGAVGGWILRNPETEKNGKLGTSEARNNAARNF